MRFFYKIFLSILLTAGLGVGGYGYWLINAMQDQRGITIEEELGNISNLLSSQLAFKIKDGTIDTANIDRAFKKIQTIQTRSSTGSPIKKNTAINAYVTDKTGTVIYDSSNPDNIGKDFNLKPDVLSALNGENGARFELSASGDPFSQKYYIGAPIKHKNRVVGSISVSKPVKSYYDVVTARKDQLILLIIVIVLIALVLAWLLTYLVSLPIKELENYAQTVIKGEIARPPKISLPDFKNFAKEFVKMKTILEQKEPIKNYVLDITHHIKSQLTAIKASAELLKNKVSQDRVGLLSNIVTEADKSTKYLNDLFELARVESQIDVKKKEKLSIKELVGENISSAESKITKKKIQVKLEWGSSEPIILGNRDILPALNNLILNAVEFSPVGGKIVIEAMEDRNKIHIFIRDQGPGIPEYARDEIYNRHYSLIRPSGEKSSGMGLAFAKQVIALHNGEIQLEPSSQEMNGANFRVSFPKN
ncbi:ATP-binding protein [Nitrospinaceae bacterium]|nr:ATP-binding protein [Nitrospinaceae bacterium]